MKKFDLVNPVIGKLTDYDLTKKILEQGEIDKLQLILDALKYGTNKDDDDEGKGGGGEGGRGDRMTERQVQIFGKKLQNKKWKKLLEG